MAIAFMLGLLMHAINQIRHFSEPLGFIVTAGTRSKGVAFVNLGETPAGRTCPTLLSETRLQLESAVGLRREDNDGFLLCGGTDFFSGSTQQRLQGGRGCLIYTKAERQWRDYDKLMSTDHDRAASTWLPGGDYVIRGDYDQGPNQPDDRFSKNTGEFSAINR